MNKLKRWSIWAQYDGKDWVEVCRCDGHPDQLRAAALLKGYDRAGIVDNWMKFVRNGQIDWCAAMAEIFGVRVVHVTGEDA